MLRQVYVGWMTWVRFLAGAMMGFSLCHHIQNGSGAHLASYTMSTGEGGSSPTVKQPRHEAHHSPPSSGKVKNAWSYIPTPSHIMMWCLLKHRDILAFTFTILLKQAVTVQCLNNLPLDTFHTKYSTLSSFQKF
jgi:hypothetical protein